MFKPKRGVYLIFAMLWVLITLGFKLVYSKVFVVGDSISMHYGPYLEESLNGFAIYDRKGGNTDGLQNLDNPAGANGGDSGMIVSYLDSIAENRHFRTDYLVVNCGLHDIKTNPETGAKSVSIRQYEKNLEKIIAISRKMDSKLVWIQSTPVVDSIHNKRVGGFKRYCKDIKRYNRIAEKIMLQNDVPVIDLYDFTLKFIPGAYQDHVHFVKEIREKQADFIAGNLVQIIKNDRR